MLLRLALNSQRQDGEGGRGEIPSSATKWLELQAGSSYHHSLGKYFIFIFLGCLEFAGLLVCLRLGIITP